MADKRIFAELKDGEVEKRANTCGVDLGDAQRYQAGQQSLLPKDVSCLKAGMADDPRSSPLDKFTGMAFRAFSEAVNSVTGSLGPVLDESFGAASNLGGLATRGSRQAKQSEAAAGYGDPVGPKR